jgi:hypothetical protein
MENSPGLLEEGHRHVVQSSIIVKLSEIKDSELTFILISYTGKKTYSGISTNQLIGIKLSIKIIKCDWGRGSSGRVLD